MTSRRGRRGAGGLGPDERSMGGALLIQSDYQNYYRKLSERPHSASPERAANAARPSSSMLSQQRARKRAEADGGQLGHAANVRAMNARLVEIASRLSPPAEAEEAHRGTLKGHRGGLGLRPWLPEAQAAAAAAAARHRPSSAPPGGQGGGSGRQQAQSPLGGGASDWQQLKARQRGRAEPPPVTEVHLPPSRFYAPGPSLLPSVQARLYRRCLLEDILARGLYQARDIEALFRRYLEVNPPEHREVMRSVIAGLRTELAVGQRGGGLYAGASSGLTPIAS